MKIFCKEEDDSYENEVENEQNEEGFIVIERFFENFAWIKRGVVSD